MESGKMHWQNIANCEKKSMKIAHKQKLECERHGIAHVKIGMVAFKMDQYCEKCDREREKKNNSHNFLFSTSKTQTETLLK